jgi:hypothetical protein
MHGQSMRYKCRDVADMLPSQQHKYEDTPRKQEDTRCRQLSELLTPYL